mmetsp:Transcript_28199/g.40389  ORF Transcript_28199/g.40389 Transcript_28199/m.40389 type:complete len:336 (+) Transcript_28199:145-1152(+)|eukprot:CAMPEP_0172431610 /NCGR_PEP_ID=MMETSP1064-20121228/59156_1 /TAXON_ID=202472 /ORGANISM="Aulacoseira subarctica , Strain CCAP 1002/5" /LENGTH=335 /DNA_ID=CAMNT_0013178397 /DNA_START=94 /DNA_END=1101 /DNA_ORIENTATION=+
MNCKILFRSHSAAHPKLSCRPAALLLSKVASSSQQREFTLASCHFRIFNKFTASCGTAGSERHKSTGLTRSIANSTKHAVNHQQEEGAWVSISSTPHFATLDDILLGISQSMEYIIRSREEEKSQIFIRDDNDNLFDMNEYRQEKNLPCHMATEARMILSRKKRPVGWFVKFPHALIAKELVRQSAHIPCRIGWKRVFPSHFDPSLSANTMRQWREPVDVLKLDETAVRVENVPRNCSEDTIRSFFRWFELADDTHGRPPAVVRLIEARKHDDENNTDRKKSDSKKPWNPKFHTFLVRFSDVAMARAAVRERHLAELLGEKLYLNHYPRQLVKVQ